MRWLSYHLPALLRAGPDGSVVRRGVARRPRLADAAFDRSLVEASLTLLDVARAQDLPDYVGVLPSPDPISTAAPPRMALDALVLDRVEFRAHERALFVQCGDGWIVEEAWRRVRRGYLCGLDTSAALIARATELRGVQDTLEFRLWDGYSLPCPSSFFHRVISTFTLQECVDPVAVLGEMQRALLPGGELYVLEFDSPAARCPGLTAPDISAALDRCGFHETRELTRREAAVIVLARNPVNRPP